jgi:kynureninase
MFNGRVTIDLSEDRALTLDAGDLVDDPALRRDDFVIPPSVGGAFPLAAYLAGNSLGAQPRATRADVMAELDVWEEYAVRGHATGPRPWGTFHEAIRGPMARIVGALPQEVTAMNTLTVNLHLLLASFYRPTPIRHRIVIEDRAFSSDSYAVRSHVALRGYDPDTAVLRLAPRPGEDTLRTEDIVRTLHEHAHSIATVLIGGVNFRTGEVVDMATITAVGHDIGATVGWDLAHAAGNVPLALHDWDVDFAAWCTYKYLNSGPGAISAAFVHERHLADRSLQRLEGWYGTDPAVRFEMRPVSDPPSTADAWIVSNPPILALAPVRTSVEIFDAVGMAALRARSLRLTAYLRALLEAVSSRTDCTIVTPAEASAHGAQLSVRVPVDAGDLVDRLCDNWGVVADDRPPDIVRLAPAPLYNTHHDCWRAVDALCLELTGEPLS